MLLSISQSYANNTWVEMRFGKVKKQVSDNTCGLASLVYIFSEHYNKEISEDELILTAGVKTEYSFLDLARLAKIFSIKTSGVKITLVQLSRIHSPAVLYLNRFGKDHFVVFNGIDKGIVQLYDPAWGMINYTVNQFYRHWADVDGYGKVLIFLDHRQVKINDDLIFEKKIPEF
ncbi:hypothetical protein EPIR_2438 [Erwinia piriflorinigrans CFBP 5888]|uniref:Peptidase C39 domain-containing protein n=2 Tax=Erwinia piriflorinigrans TaxID=665097 RepID=V5Z9U1_9GAMM|nr:hypothetical protein EPIR_2438 [Erwinia piriflorinigrans CFBP 5888]